jgi:hypothetical protein
VKRLEQVNDKFAALKVRRERHSSRIFNARKTYLSLPDVSRLATFSQPLRGTKEFSTIQIIQNTTVE